MHRLLTLLVVVVLLVFAVRAAGRPAPDAPAFAAAHTTLASISGVVVDDATSLPLAGARVGVQTVAPATSTAADGSFSLDGSSGYVKVVAALPGYYNASVSVTAPASGVELRLHAVPQDDDHGYVFMTPDDCANCHWEQATQWTGTPMARAGINTWVYDLYDGSGTAHGTGGFVYTRDSRLAAAHPASECASCHQPEPWVEQPYRALEPLGNLSAGALHGVSCEVCHKIAHVDESKLDYPGLYPGAVRFTRPTVASGPVEYGVLGDADYAVAPAMRPSYLPQLTAEVCAVCHQDKNDPDGDGDFEEPNGIISEPTYLEWKNGPYADPESPRHATCISCHMPPSGFPYASEMGPLRDPQQVRHHRIEGTTPAFLERAAMLSLQCQTGGGSVTAQVVVTNSGAGHFIPTGVTVRNMILLVEAWRTDGLPLTPTGGQVVHTLGGVGDPAQGYYAGRPGKLYAKVIRDSAGAAPTFFTDAAGIVFDNRIPPLASDTTQYAFAVPQGGGAVHVRARLVYRRSFRALVDAKQWTQDGQGRALEDVQPPYFGHLMAEAQWTNGVLAADGTPSDEGGRVWVDPNPCMGPTTIGWRLAQGSAVTLDIVDVEGRRVAVLAEGYSAAGAHAIRWDGRGRRGEPAAPGVYFARLRTPADTRFTRIVRLR